MVLIPLQCTRGGGAGYRPQVQSSFQVASTLRIIYTTSITGSSQRDILA